ncbi:MAG TPA: mismatch-specific DNA-glycosylase [Oscillospiraceae bacterium]|nr:mismatch-specific DNA-glycosylase [Oscillospiraceae bacterium]
MDNLPEYLDDNLKVVFVGYNPGEKAAALGHHYAGRGNQFWRLLFDAGLTNRLYLPTEDGKLLQLGYGLTNIVSRPSRSSSELHKKELQAGAEVLREKLRRFQPYLVCLLGKEVYRHYAGLKSSASYTFGAKATATIPGIKEFAAPNPSARSTIPYGVKLAYFVQISQLLRSR